MTSPLLALFTRSLREDSRGAAAYWARAGLAVFILLVLTSIASSNSWAGAPGKNFFIGIVTLQAVAISFIGLSYFGSAISEEKEEQTLGLLRMTDLNPLSILLGKSTSRLCGALLLLIALFPFTIFAVTLGGVSLGQIAATYCTLGAYTFLLGNLALLGSVLARRTAGASVFTTVVMAALLSAGPLLENLDLRLTRHGLHLPMASLANDLWKATPIARLIEILGTGFNGSIAGWQVATNLIAGVGFFLLAWLAFGRFCDRAPAEGGSVSPTRKVLGLRLGRPARPRTHPLAWKDFHFLTGGRIGLIVRVLVLLYGGLIGYLSLDSFDSNRSFKLTGYFSILSFVYSIDVAAMAARIFGTEIRDQTLSALAGLPLTIRQIAYRKALACVLVALPGGILVVAGTIMNIALLYRNMSGANAQSPQLVNMLIAQAVTSLVNIALLVHVVAWLSLIMKRGALPVGYVAAQAFHALIAVVGMTITIRVAGLSGGNLAFGAYSQFIAIGASLIAIGVLHRACLRRLEARASES